MDFDSSATRHGCYTALRPKPWVSQTQGLAGPERKDYLAEYFDRYRGAIIKKIDEGGGKAAINKLGEHLKAQPEFDDRVYNAALGKTKRLEQIVEALGFMVDGTNVRRKREITTTTLAAADEELD